MRYLTVCRWLLLAATIASCGCADRPVAGKNHREYALSIHGVVCLQYIRITTDPVKRRIVMPSGYAWKEYRDDTPITKVGDTIAIYLWLAGRDVGADLIGFSASIPSEELMNTIAVCPDDGPADVEVIPGFVLHRHVVP